MAEMVISSVVGLIVEKLATPLFKMFGNLVGVEDNVKKLRETLPRVQAVLEDAEEQQATNAAAKIWLTKFQKVAYDADDLLLQLSADDSLRNLQYAGKVKQMLHALEKATDEALGINFGDRSAVGREWNRRETSSVESEVYGRDLEKEEIVKLLLSREPTDGGKASCIPIVGMGGIGKTTLAQLAYNDERITERFEVKVWVFVSDQFNVKNIMTAVIDRVNRKRCSHSNMDELHSAVSSVLRNKRYLIVLDDVWTEDQVDWDNLKPLFRGGLDGSKVLLTTRSKRVALITVSPTSPYYLKELSEDACWSLFKQYAFQQREEEHHPALLPVGQQIVGKCGGIALAAKTLGSLMKFKRNVREWEFVRDSELWNLEGCKREILSVLRLSYSRLPLHLKRCLAFCSIFPRSYEFKKHKLIHQWIAAGFVPSAFSSRGKEPEDVGNDYFCDLEWMFFFQEIKQHENGGAVIYKMHNVIYDLVQSVSNSEYTKLERGSATPPSFAQIRHSSVVCDFGPPKIPEELYEADHLRTLLLFSGGNFEVVPPKLYSSFSYLVMLDLSGLGLKTLDGSIGDLLHLKYLDLSYTHIRKLPSEIEHLHSLQTLNLFNCSNLEALPNLTRMTNLRHLNNDGCNALTKMLESQGKSGFMGENFTLQTLPLFVLSEDHDMKYLGKLINLRGSLKITHLEKVSTACSPNLDSKKGVESLGLYWGNDDGCPNINPEGEFGDVEFRGGKRIHLPGPSQGLDRLGREQVLFALYPNTNLERLLIKGYSGCKFPSWFLPNLTRVDLINCRQGNILPVLGDLQFLTSLSLREMHGVKRIYKEFYSKGNKKPFPSLKELVLVDFPNLEVWSSPDVGEEAFPKLSKLILNKCPKLTVMPQILSVQHLELQECRTTFHFFGKVTPLEKLIIDKVRFMLDFQDAFPSNCPHLRSLEIKSCPSFYRLPRGFENLDALKSLTIRWCEKLSSLPQSLHNLTALESLEISDCHGLTSLPEGGNRGLSKLRSLSIESCNNLTSLSMGFQYLTSLEILTIMCCPRISTLPETVEHLSSLQSLSILGLPQLHYLPEGLQKLNVLHSLKIGSCPSLKVLPGWVEKLGSLRSLTISGCQDLQSLPEGMKRLTALLHLSIRDCPQLEERCRQEQGDDWSKIEHVPNKHIGSPNLKRPREEGSSSAN